MTWDERRYSDAPFGRARDTKRLGRGLLESISPFPVPLSYRGQV